jgi:hypothetical protein
MAFFAPVCPPRIYSELKKDPRLFGSYFLLLAHDVIKSEESRHEYHELFARRVNGFVHMDNSVVELGDSVTMDMLFEAASVVRADTIALPDVYKKSAETVESTFKGYEEFQRLSKKYSTSVEPLIIPQGETWIDWLRCLEVLAMNLPDITWVGLPRNITGRIAPSRLDAIQATWMLLPKARIHLMGFSDNPFDDLRCCFVPGVIGIDSAVPLRSKTLFMISNDAGSRGDWWETGNYTQQTAANIVRVRNMIGDNSGYPSDFKFEVVTPSIAELFAERPLGKKMN